MENIIARNVVSSSLSRCLSSTESRKSLRLQELRIFRLSRVYNRMSGLRCIRAWTSVVQRMAEESGEPVVLSCTGATASRNYIPGLTEAYYRKLPVLAVTSTQDISRIGHHIAQVIDRRVIQNDIALLSEYIPATDDSVKEWSNTVRINCALLELRHRGGGPVHLNMETTYSRDYSVRELPQARMIRRVMPKDLFPELPKGRVAVVVGTHRKFTDPETAALDAFCSIIPAATKGNTGSRSPSSPRKRRTIATW